MLAAAALDGKHAAGCNLWVAEGGAGAQPKGSQGRGRTGARPLSNVLLGEGRAVAGVAVAGTPAAGGGGAGVRPPTHGGGRAGVEGSLGPGRGGGRWMVTSVCPSCEEASSPPSHGVTATLMTRPLTLLPSPRTHRLTKSSWNSLSSPKGSKCTLVLPFICRA